MNIIKSGSYKKQIIVECSRCDCVFSTTKSDLKMADRYSSYSYSIDCPECEKEIELYESDIEYAKQAELAREHDVDWFEFREYDYD